MTLHTSDAGDTKPERSTLVLMALIIVAGVANMNLSVASVALPAIGRDLDASGMMLNLIAVGYSLGLAASVLYFGALGDRYGRKRLLVIGMLLSLPASLVAGTAGNAVVLFVARVVGGISAGLAFPTTLAIITALWSGALRTKAIAAWSALGAAISTTGPLISGALLEVTTWHWVFLITLPLALVALVGAYYLVPSDSGDRRATVDNVGGVTSIVFVATLVLALNFAPVKGYGLLVIVLAAIALTAGVGFALRQLHVRVPLFDLKVAARPTFWVAAVAGLVVFGTLMGVTLVGSQYLQNVLGFSTLVAGSMIVPAAVAMVIVAPRSAALVEARGARFTLLLGYSFIVAGISVSLFTWREHASLWVVVAAYILIGIGIGFAGTPASRSLTGSVPVERAGMASSMSDLQRDLGGAIMQSILGAILTAGYTRSLTKEIAASPNAGSISSQTQAVLTKSFSSAADLAQHYPQYAPQIMRAAKDAFVHGEVTAYSLATVIVLVGAAVVYFCYPRHDRERELMHTYATQKYDA